MEILGYLEKVFYDGNSRMPGGKYIFTVINIETNERIELKVKLHAKEDFVVGVIYRIEYYEEDNYVYNMVLMYDSIQDFIDKKVSYRNYNYIKNPNQYKILIIKYVVFAIIVTLFLQILINLLK